MTERTPPTLQFSDEGPITVAEALFLMREIGKKLRIGASLVGQTLDWDRSLCAVSVPGEAHMSPAQEPPPPAPARESPKAHESSRLRTPEGRAAWEEECRESAAYYRKRLIERGDPRV